MNNPLLTEAIGVYLIDMDTAVEEQVNYNEDGASLFLSTPGLAVNSRWLLISMHLCISYKLISAKNVQIQ